MIKDFFKKNSHLKLGLQHLDLLGGGWKIEIYNTTYDFGIDPIFEHYIVDEELERLNVDFETAIMTPVINWKEDLEKKRDLYLNREKNYQHERMKGEIIERVL